MSTVATGTSVVAIAGRISESTACAAAVEPLAEELATRIGESARTIGTAGTGWDREDENWSTDLEAARGLVMEAGGQVDDALTAGRRPLIVAGDCAVAIGTLPVVGTLAPDARVLWLDAHGDYNTPTTSPSGWLGGMGLAGACGEWDTGMGGAFPAGRAVLCGVRALDDGERLLLEGSGATVIGPSLETLVYMQNALDGAPVYIHLDPDVLDPEHFASEHPAPGGLTPERLHDLLDAVADTCEVVGLEVCSVSDPSPRGLGALLDAVSPILKKMEDA